MQATKVLPVFGKRPLRQACNAASAQMTKNTNEVVADNSATNSKAVAPRRENASNKKNEEIAAQDISPTTGAPHSFRSAARFGRPSVDAIAAVSSPPTSNHPFSAPKQLIAAKIATINPAPLPMKRLMKSAMGAEDWAICATGIINATTQVAATDIKPASNTPTSVARGTTMCGSRTARAGMAALYGPSRAKSVIPTDASAGSQPIACCDIPANTASP